MVYYLPIIGAVALAGGTILERLVLKRKGMDVKLYQTASFLAIVLCLIPLLFFFWRLDAGALTTKNAFLFLLVVFFSIIANLLVFYSMKFENLGNLEPAKVLEPLFVIVLAIIFSFFTEGLYDRNLKVVVPAIFASLALVFTHIKRHHLNFNKYFVAAIFGSFFFALELVISRAILDFYSPITFYFLRSMSIFLISFIAFTPDLRRLDSKAGKHILLTGFIWMIYRVIVYYGYLNIGVIFTTLMLMLGPIFIYTLAHFILRERMSWKNFLAAIVIVISVIYALI